MSVTQYFRKAQDVLRQIEETQVGHIRKAAELFAESIVSGRVVHMYGSGHSVIPVMDMFPRYGAYAGFHPLQDPRLMWTAPTGPGGAPELLWLERREGYAEIFLDSFDLRPDDAMLVFSHGGLNAAPLEVAKIAREKGLNVVVVTSVTNHQTRQSTHSTGKKLADFGHVVIDNCCPPEDALVNVEGVVGPVAASSTLAATYIAMALIAETAAQLAVRGHHVRPFVSPNVTEAPPDTTARVYAEYRERTRGIRR